MCVANISGLDIDNWKPGDPLVREGSLSYAVMHTQTSLLNQPESIDEIVGRFPRLNIIFQAELRLIMCVPLAYRDDVIGVLHFRLKKPNTYTEKGLRSNRYGHPLTLLLLDLDDFKAFNDAYGHVEGDQVLMRLGQVVKRCLRETDFAFRYSGEEFTIILPMTTSADGAVIAERIRTEFKKEIFSPTPG